MNIIKSNYLTNLTNALINNINKTNDFFKKTIVIVPNKKIEAYVKAYFLKNYDDVLMNVIFYDVYKGLFNLFNVDNNIKIATKCQIRSLVIKYLYDNPKNDYASYLDGDVNGVKLFDLSNKIADAFIKYDEDLYEIKGNQKNIYKYVMEELKKNNLVTLKYLYETANFKDLGTLYVFGFTNYTKLEIMILNKYNDVLRLDLALDGNETFNYDKTIIKCPSKLREIEYLHSSILNIMKEDKNAKFSDFLVISNNLSEYENDINRVFRQDDIEYPNIPYCFSSSRNIGNATNELFEILNNAKNKGFYTRLDLVNVLKNALVRKIREIDDDVIDKCVDSILKMNIYRKDDWTYLKTRMLLAKFSDINDPDDEILLPSGKSISFSVIGLNDDIIVKIINVIDDLEIFINIDSYQSLNEELNKWLSINEFGIEKNLYLVRINDLIDYFINNDIKSHLNIVLYSISEITSKPRNGSIQLFNSGVTFSTLETNTILNSKYVYLIGASSENLPIKKSKNPLDERNIDVDYTDEKNTFNLFFYNAISNGSSLNISYVNMDLETYQEQYFLSNYVKNCLKPGFNNFYVFKLDEIRNWNELYTKREFMNKLYKDGLLVSNKNDNRNDFSNQVVRNKVKLTDLANCLFEPIRAKLELLFGSNDETNERINDQFEHLELSPILKAELFKKIFKELVNDCYATIIGLGGAFINYVLRKRFNLDIEDEEVFKILYDEELIRKHNDLIDNLVALYDRFILENKLISTSNIISQLEFINVTIEALNYVSYLKKYGTIEFLKYNDIAIENDDQTFTIIPNKEIIRVKNDESIIYLPIKILEKHKMKDRFEAYIYSLLDLYINSYNDKKVKVILKVKNSERTHEISFKITGKEAYQMLIKIYDEYNNFMGNKFFDYNCLEDIRKNIDKNGNIDIDNLKYNEYYDLLYIIEKKDTWNYFCYANMLDLFNQLGYGNDFLNEYLEYYKKRDELILFKEEKENE